jgi:hypothetical protein
MIGSGNRPPIGPGGTRPGPPPTQRSPVPVRHRLGHPRQNASRLRIARRLTGLPLTMPALRHPGAGPVHSGRRPCQWADCRTSAQHAFVVSRRAWCRRERARQPQRRAGIGIHVLVKQPTGGRELDINTRAWVISGPGQRSTAWRSVNAGAFRSAWQGSITRRPTGADTATIAATQNLCVAPWRGAATAVRPADSGSGMGAGTLSDCVGNTETSLGHRPLGGRCVHFGACQVMDRYAVRTMPGSQLVEDVAAAYAEWSGGAEFLTEAKDHGRETRAYIRDPDGHLIEVGQTTMGPNSS